MLVCDKVALHSYTVDLDAFVLQYLDDSYSAVSFKTRRLEVVVVVVQLGIRVDFGRNFKRMLDKVLAKHVIED